MGDRRSRGRVGTLSLSQMGFVTSAYEKPSKGQVAASTAKGLLGLVASVALLVVGLSPILYVGYRMSEQAIGNTWAAIPSDVPSDLPLSQHSVMVDVNGKPFAQFFSENRVPVTAAQIPDSVRDALIATEDSRFYQHHGVDVQGTVRALLSTVRGGGTQGGSGITQQYVKNLLIANATTDEQVAAATEQTIGRKITEAKAAIELEKRMPKDQILTGYLNTVYFGDGAYGIGAAARHYFNKTPDQLTVPEAATLIGIINSPTAYNPVDHPEASRERRNHVLARMESEGYVSAADAAKWEKQRIKLRVTETANGCSKSKYPFYCAWVRQTLAENPAFGKTAAERQLRLYRGGMTIRTALNPKVQNVANKVAREALDPRGGPATAIAVVQPGTGRVAAIATNKAYGTKSKGKTEILLPVVPAFQQGSTFKPYTAVTALEAGYNPTFSLYAQDSFSPVGRNSPDGGFRNAGDGPGGEFDMAGALRRSVNTWFVQMEDKVGVREVARTASKMGLTSLPLTGDRAITEKDASLTLGSYEVSVVQVANTYATIAAHGVACTPTNIVSITDARGTKVAVPEPNCRQVIRRSTADTVASMLGGVIDGKDPGRTGKNASLGRPAGGKTGTTNNAAAVWFAGFTPQWATAVWIGDPRGGFKYPLNDVTVFGEYYSPVYGGGAPAEIWRRVMLGANAGLPKVPLPRAGGDTSVGVPVVVPDVRGLTPEKAAAILAEAGFTATIAPEPGPQIPGLEPGLVSRTKPKAGTIVKAYDLPRNVQLFRAP